jgi:hypothetical protein
MEKAELNKLCDKVTELDILFEKIELLADNMDQDFFSLREGPDVLYDFKRFSITNDILVDYIHAMDEKIGSIKRMLDIV